MLFNSLEFFIFLIIVFAAYWMLDRWFKIQNLLIVIASYVFYAWWDWKFLLILFSLSLTTYISGYYISKHTDSNYGKNACVTNIAICVLSLGLFKYYNFFTDSLTDFLLLFKIKIDRIVSQFLLPIGISFYTFKCISYTFDVYKKNFIPSNDFIAFLAYISFFPQLMAGPIDRASILLSQFYKKRTFIETQASDGCRQMLWGFFKKIVIADNCQLAVNQIWGGQFSEPGCILFLVAILFSFQIYCDFSGYSDIAIGSAKLFGINLSQNFRYPYFSQNIGEFWRRWHISLMTWLRDYIYIPLGGSRCSSWKINRNILVVWIISGLWHGANWTFVCWGFFHAILLILYRTIIKLNSNRDEVFIARVQKPISDFVTFIFVTIGWIFFRANSITEAFVYIRNIYLNPFGLTKGIEYLQLLHLQIILPSIIILLLVEWLGRYMQYGLQICKSGFLSHNRIARYSVYFVLVMLIMAFSDSQSEFIYFRF